MGGGRRREGSVFVGGRERERVMILNLRHWIFLTSDGDDDEPETRLSYP